MQRDIVLGRLICSKEEAATLAAVQLRLEAWPEENLELAEGKPGVQRRFSFISCCSADDELHTLNLTLNDQTSPTSLTSTGGFSALHSMTSSWRDRHRRNLIKFRLTDIPCCKRMDSSFHKSKKPFLPPDFRHSNEILKLIKVILVDRLPLDVFFFSSLGQTTKTVSYQRLRQSDAFERMLRSSVSKSGEFQCGNLRRERTSWKTIETKGEFCPFFV